MIINGIDFDKRLDYAKQWNNDHIDCLFDCQHIMDKEGPTGVAPCDTILKVIACAQRVIQFHNKPIHRIGTVFESGTIHTISAGDQILTHKEAVKLITKRS